MTIERMKVCKTGAFNPLRCFLEEIPLYAMLLPCCALDDPINQKLSIAALNLLTVTYRPLSILELA